jgi:hypothetical protein
MNHKLSALKHNNLKLQRSYLFSILNSVAARPLETTFNDRDPLDRTTTTTRRRYRRRSTYSRNLSIQVHTTIYKNDTYIYIYVAVVDLNVLIKKMYRILRNSIFHIIYVNGSDRFKHL